jgi:hypothetical protein
VIREEGLWGSEEGEGERGREGEREKRGEGEKRGGWMAGRESVYIRF